MSHPAAKVYKATARITDKFQVEVKARDYTICFDEPKPISNGEGMTPLEGLLGAISACKSMVAKTTAHKMGIDYRSMEIEVSGNFDSRGYQGDPNFYIGFSDIHTIYHIDTDAPEEKLQQLISFVDKHCPAAATIKDSAPMKSSIQRK